MTRRRTLFDAAARVVIYVTAVLALIPLGLVLLFVANRGWHAAIQPDFYIHVWRPAFVPGGGVEHAIAGTLIMVGLASLMAVPVGILAGVYLVEYGHGRLADYIRLASDVLVGAPSIAIGLFAYALFVVPAKHYSGYSASIALAVLMLPVVLRTTEAAVGLIPGALRESGIALGLPRWRISLQLVLPAAIPGVVTGALLAVARAAGETAPLLFTAFGNRILNLDPNGQMEALPMIVYNDARTPYVTLQQEAWGAALVLVAMVLVINLSSRFVLRRQIRLAGKI
jgi:phosphate transport system permease protein